ncbi:hypothetical protein RFI_36099, partial [Reticulomyxa filosa]
RCLGITKDDKRITWCPKKSNDVNFYGEMGKENWAQHFEDLKQVLGGLSHGEYLEDESKNKIQSGKELERVWMDRYADDSSTWWLQLKVTSSSPGERCSEHMIEGEQGQSEIQVQANEKREGSSNEQDPLQSTHNASNDIDQEEEEEEKQRQKDEYFDIRLMLELVKKAEETTTAIKDQNVILLLGGTGVGKSTLIHYLAGSTLEQQIVNGVPHIAPTQTKSSALTNVQTKPGTKSVTRYVTAVPINLADMGIYSIKEPVALCDTPGFEDTSGAEVDVANGIGLVGALQNCRSVKPVVLICYTAQGYRMSCIKSLARTLVAIMPSIKDHLTAFSYVFTKCPDNKVQFIHSEVKQICEGMPQNESDEGYVAILEDIVDKTEGGVNAPDLLKTSPKNLLKKLVELDKFIKHPDEVFHPFVSESSNYAVHAQVQKHKENIELSFRNGDYKLAKIKLSELKDLNSVLKNEDIEHEYNDCIAKLTKEWNQTCESSKSMFNTHITSLHPICKDDVLAYQKVVDKLTSAAELQHFLPDAICADSLDQNLEKQINDIIRIIQTQMEEDMSALQVPLDKIAQVQACFPTFTATYTNICQKLQTGIEKSIEEAKKFFKENNFAEFRMEIEKLGKAMPLHEHLCSVIDIQKEIEDLERGLLRHLKHTKEEGLCVLKKSTKRDTDNLTESENEKKGEDKKVELGHVRVEKLDKTDVGILQAKFVILDSASSAFELPCAHVGLDKSARELASSFVSEIVGYLEKMGQKIACLFETQRYEALDKIKDIILVMDDLRSMGPVKQRTEGQYYQIIERIFAFVREVQSDINRMMSSLSKPNTTLDYNRLYECVLCVSRSNWINERHEGGTSNSMDVIKKSLISHLWELQQRSEELELDLDCCEQFDEAHKIIMHLEKLRRLEEVIPELTHHRQEIVCQLEQPIRDTLAAIQREFALEKKSATKQEEIKYNLIQIKSCTEGVRKANSYLHQMKYKNAQDIDRKIANIEEELQSANSMFAIQNERFQEDSIICNQQLDQLCDIEVRYGLLCNDSTKSKRRAIISFLRKNGYSSIDQVRQAKREEEKEMYNLKQKESASKHTQEQQISKLKSDLNDMTQIKKKYEELLKNEGSSLELISESLKTYHFTDSEIQRLIQNEHELNGKIRQYEREIAKLANNNGYYFDVLDPARIEKTLLYLKQCKASVFSTNTTSVTKEIEKTLFPLKQEIADTLTLIDRFLREYANMVQHQLNLSRVNESEDNDNAQMIEQVEITYNRLNEVKKLNDCHPMLFEYFPNDIMEKFCSRLRQIHLDLSDAMLNAVKLTNLKPLKSKIAVAKALCALDNFARPDCQFRDLFLEYQKKIVNDLIDTRPMLEAINQCRYVDVASEISKIKQRADGDARVEDVIFLGENDIDLKEIETIERQLQQIKEAKQYVIEFVDEKTQEDIEKKEDDTKAAFQQWMEMVLGTVDASVNASNFLEAENKIKLIRRIVGILSNYCEPISSNKTTEDTNDIKNRVNTLEKTIVNKLDDIVKQYKDINLEERTLNPYSSCPPKELYEKLKKIMETTAMYKETWRKIQGDITQKIREQLKDICSKAGQLNQWDIEKRIQLCKSVLKTLPEPMKSDLEEEIVACEKEIQYRIKNENEEVNGVIKSKNVEDICKLLNNGTSNQTELIKANLTEITQKISNSLEKKWAEDDIKGALEQLKELFRYKLVFQEKMPELNRCISIARDTLINNFDKCHNNIVTHFAFSDHFDMDTSTIEIVEKSLILVLECMTLKKDTLEMKENKNKEEILPDDFNDKIKDLDTK